MGRAGDRVIGRRHVGYIFKDVLHLWNMRVDVWAAIVGGGKTAGVGALSAECWGIWVGGCILWSGAWTVGGYHALCGAWYQALDANDHPLSWFLVNYLCIVIVRGSVVQRLRRALLVEGRCTFVVMCGSGGSWVEACVGRMGGSLGWSWRLVTFK